MKKFKKGGIHPPQNKITADIPISVITRPNKYYIPVAQSIGAPAVPCVKAGDMVNANDVIATASGFVSVPVHTPVSGKVEKIENIRNPQGLWQQCIIIVPDDSERELLSDGVGDSSEAVAINYSDHAVVRGIIENLSADEIVGKVQSAGIVGLGGATFPTHVKIKIPADKHVDYMIINGAECEPWLTCDDRLMREQADKIIVGVRLLQKATGASRALIGIENNKPQAIKAMMAACDFEGSGISVMELRTCYPQGSEKQLIEALTGRCVPPGKLPLDVACVVDNVATAAAVAEGVLENRPLTRRVATVTGPSVKNPGNYIVEIGMSIEHLINQTGGLPEDTGKIIGGGPMMGRAMSHPEAPVTKGLGGVLIFPEEMSNRLTADPCIRCARCVTACPMGLQPYLLESLARNRRFDDCKSEGVLNCIECGCCSWSCPAARPLLDYIRLARTQLRKK